MREVYNFKKYVYSSEIVEVRTVATFLLDQTENGYVPITGENRETQQCGEQ